MRASKNKNQRESSYSYNMNTTERKCDNCRWKTLFSESQEFDCDRCQKAYVVSIVSNFGNKEGVLIFKTRNNWINWHFVLNRYVITASKTITIKRINTRSWRMTAKTLTLTRVRPKTKMPRNLKIQMRSQTRTRSIASTAGATRPLLTCRYQIIIILYQTIYYKVVLNLSIHLAFHQLRAVRPKFL